MSTNVRAVDSHTPAEMALAVQDMGIDKANLSLSQTLTLSVLAGAFIALGAMFFTLVMTAQEVSFGVGRAMGGLAFSLGLILVVIGGAELFKRHIHPQRG